MLRTERNSPAAPVSLTAGGPLLILRAASTPTALMARLGYIIVSGRKLGLG
jgi:hypothetical protein